MQTKNKDNIGKEKGRSTAPLYVGLFMGIVFSAICVVCYFISDGTLSKSKKETTSAKKETSSLKDNPSPDRSETASSSKDNALIKQALLARMAQRDSKEESGESEEAKIPDFKPDKKRKAWIRDIAQLKEELPGNMIVPGRKTGEEEKRFIEHVTRHQHYRNLIKNNEATESDLKAYRDESVKYYQDEMALLDYCERNLEDSRSSGAQPNGYCLQAEEIGIDDSRARTQNSLANIEKDYQNGFQSIRDRYASENNVRQDDQPVPFSVQR